MTDSVKFESSIKRAEVVSSYSVKRLAVVVQAKDVPVYSEANKAGFKPEERWRFIYEPAELVSFGLDPKSEASKYLQGALKASGKYANISYLPNLTGLEVLCIVKREDESAVKSIRNANLSMEFGYYGLVLAKSLEAEVEEVVNTFGKDYLIALEDSTLFGDVAEPSAAKRNAKKHLFESLIGTNAPVSLNYQLPKVRGELEPPLSAVVMSYICATFGTERPGVSAYFKTLEGVVADNLPSFVISAIDEQYKRRINTYRANEVNSYKWNVLADGESVEVVQLVRYAEKTMEVRLQNLLKNAIPFNDNGFNEAKLDFEAFLGTLIRAEKVQSFEVVVPRFSQLTPEDRELQRLPVSATITVNGVIKEIGVSAIFSK